MEVDNELEYEDGKLILAKTSVGNITVDVNEKLFELMDEFNTVSEFKEYLLL